MQKPLFSAAVFAALFLFGEAGAQTPASSAPVVTPSTPAPAVAAPAAPAPAAAPNQVIYSPRLPSATELTNAAAAQGVTVDRIEQTSSQITVTYKYASGQTNTVAYQLLPTGTATAQVAPAPQTTVVQSAPPTVIYAEPPPRVIYYDEPVYYPRYYYPPVSFSLGFGFRSHSFHHGGGFHHRWR